MERLVVRNDLRQMHVEIRSKDERWFWAFWLATVSVALAVSTRSLPQLKIDLWPLWLIWILGACTLELKGLDSLVWSMHGIERLSIDGDQFVYERRGSLLNNETVRIPKNDLSAIEILSEISPLQPNRLKLRSTKRTLGIGRSLTIAEAQNLSDKLHTLLPELS